MLKLNFKAIDDPSITLPRRATKHSAGYDLFCPYPINITPGSHENISLGITWDPDWNPLPEFDDTGLRGVFAKIFDKSGHAYKFKFATLAGVIDLDFARRNTIIAGDEKSVEWKLICINHGHATIQFEKHQKIAQFVLLPYLIADDEDTTNTETKRAGGLGSTGL